MDPNDMQRRMQELQKSGEFSSAFSKILSGRPGYNAVIEKKVITIRCTGCGFILEDTVKFCPECGTKAQRPQEN
jgi:rubrerythrin